MMARFKTTERVDGAHGATITIDRERGIVSVRPKGRRTEYKLPLGFVAEMIVARVAKLEAARAS